MGGNTVSLRTMEGNAVRLQSIPGGTMGGNVVMGVVSSPYHGRECCKSPVHAE